MSWVCKRCNKKFDLDHLKFNVTFSDLGNESIGPFCHECTQVIIKRLTPDKLQEDIINYALEWYEAELAIKPDDPSSHQSVDAATGYLLTAIARWKEAKNCAKS